MKNQTPPLPPKIQLYGVESSNIAKIGYCEKNQIIRVQFHYGGTYDYVNCKPPMYLAFKLSNSKGKFFDKYLKNNPAHKFIKVENP